MHENSPLDKPVKQAISPGVSSGRGVNRQDSSGAVDRARLLLLAMQEHAMAARFIDRLDAGRALARTLDMYRDSDAVVVGMARGGVIVGYAVTERLGLPLAALVVRKLGAPENPELAIGAVSETGDLWLDRRIVEATGAGERYIHRQIAEQVAEAKRRQQTYAIGRGLYGLQGKTAIVVDDGIATGASAVVAIRSARGLRASSVILAVPVASRQASQTLLPLVDHLVVLAQPEPFSAVGLYYEHFNQVTDAEVVSHLRRADQRGAAGGP